jgi:hypothetical protein
VKEIVDCSVCLAGTKVLLTGEGNPFTCPYCKGTGKREIDVVDPSHEMSEWISEILAPCGEPRFYAVRHCKKCGEEEWDHAAGHFFHGLLRPCIADNEYEEEEE